MEYAQFCLFKQSFPYAKTPDFRAFYSWRSQLCSSFYSTFSLWEKKLQKEAKIFAGFIGSVGEKINWMARLSPLVMFARSLQTFGGTARRENASQTFQALQTRQRRDHFRLWGTELKAAGFRCKKIKIINFQKTIAFCIFLLYNKIWIKIYAEKIG